MDSPKHLGIVACSSEGASLCYRTFCLEAGSAMGLYDHPEVSMHTHSLSRYMSAIHAGNWQAVADLMLDSAEKLAKIGADLLICPDNTIHQSMDLVEPKSPIPWLDIAQEVVAEANRQNYHSLAILGTKYLMEGPVYRHAAGRAGLTAIVPSSEDREHINNVIFQELVNGITKPDSRTYFNAVMQKMKSLGCDAAVLGCTEIPLLIDPARAPLDTLDSTRILARAALRCMLGS